MPVSSFSGGGARHVAYRAFRFCVKSIIRGADMAGRGVCGGVGWVGWVGGVGGVWFRGGGCREKLQVGAGRPQGGELGAVLYSVAMH